MGANHHRRDFLKTAAGTGAALGLANLDFLSHLRPVSAAEAKLDPNKVRYGDDIEPLVRLLEDTPRERVLEEVARGSRRGWPTSSSWRRFCWRASAIFSRGRLALSFMPCWS